MKPSANPTLPETSRGCIVVLRGATASGKTTICKKVLQQNAELDESEQLNWLVDGADLAFQRGEDVESSINNAVAHAKNGNPAILDLGPTPIDFDVVLRRAIIREGADKIPIFKSIVYTPIIDIAHRTHLRNEAAVINDDLQDSRPNAAAYVFNMTYLFTYSPEFGITSISLQQIKDAFQIFSPEDPKDKIDAMAKSMFERFGLPPGRPDQETMPIRVDRRNAEYDRIFFPDSLEESDKIARGIRQTVLQMTNKKIVTIAEGKANYLS